MTAKMMVLEAAARTDVLQSSLGSKAELSRHKAFLRHLVLLQQAAMTMYMGLRDLRDCLRSQTYCPAIVPDLVVESPSR